MKKFLITMSAVASLVIIDVSAMQPLQDAGRQANAGNELAQGPAVALELRADELSEKTRRLLKFEGNVITTGGLVDCLLWSCDGYLNAVRENNETDEYAIAISEVMNLFRIYSNLIPGLHIPATRIACIDNALRRMGFNVFQLNNLENEDIQANAGNEFAQGPAVALELRADELSEKTRRLLKFEGNVITTGGLVDCLLWSCDGYLNAVRENNETDEYAIAISEVMNLFRIYSNLIPGLHIPATRIACIDNALRRLGFNVF